MVAGKCNRVATPGTAALRVCEGGVDVRYELALRSAQRQVEAPGGDKVCRDAAYLPPGVLGEARLVCALGENFGGEVGVRAIVNYKANDSHETTGRCKKVEQKGVTVRRTGAKLW